MFSIDIEPLSKWEIDLKLMIWCGLKYPDIDLNQRF